jgi:hypothetical protein
MTRRFKEIVSIQDIDDIIREAVERAKNNDAQARQFIADFALVKPKNVENESPDLRIGGDFNLMLNGLTPEQLELLAGLNDKLKPTISDVTNGSLAIPEPGLQEPSGRGEPETGSTPPPDVQSEDESAF